MSNWPPMFAGIVTFTFSGSEKEVATQTASFADPDATMRAMQMEINEGSHLDLKPVRACILEERNNNSFCSHIIAIN